MGLFSRTPPVPLPEREDVRRALNGMHAKDAERLRSKRHLAEALAAVPETTSVRAVLSAVVTEPQTTDRGLLCVTSMAVTFDGEHSGRLEFPIAALREVGTVGAGTLRVDFDELAPGVRALPGRESADHMDFSVTARPESVRYFVGQVEASGLRSR
ncbi:hypothetical protein [Actinomycetospora chibensis]|uniref:Uncharacterized protein n=1 Tax=Actinomycetospora chibensis TaxID=663606 RepID=A0ABV9REV0_9PSEU|nr:hypothetical protein [Actinomycetospora chibensis]MDD7926755.1 hypothetical protein [Actinomycetospora chibensis]